VIEFFRFAGSPLAPNSALPLAVMRAPLPLDPDDPASTFEEIFARNGWTRSWRNGIYPYSHFHSTAHEVLGLASGAATVRFGGAEGRVLELGTGDVVVVPAGVAHQLVAEHGRLLVVGAYAGGRLWDILREREGASAVARPRIAAVPLPEADPLAGPDGPVLASWREACATAT
jgi:uncharacterized protein YjlB